MKKTDEYTFFASYAPGEAKHMLEAFEENGVAFEIEVTTRSGSALTGGSFGEGTRYKVYIPKKKKALASQIQDQLFLGGRPIEES